jgi:hypothetical protein
MVVHIAKLGRVRHVPQAVYRDGRTKKRTEREWQTETAYLGV